MPKPRKPKGLSNLTPHAIQSHERCIRAGEALVAFWLERGYKVRVSVDPLHQMVDGKATLAIVGFELKSDMINGLPRDYGRERPAAATKVRRVNLSAEAMGGLFHY
jgi:hypothetical protein